MTFAEVSLRKLCIATGACAALVGCAPTSQNVNLVEGPAIADVVTPFDKALACLDGKIDKRFGFAVGNVPDATGRESYNGAGTGKYITQASGDIVQSALFKTGVKVINRRDVGSTALEANWGLRDLQSQMKANFVITGSVNSLDFIPGAGAFVNVGGFGARYRQNRILVGLDLAMTNLATGQVLANIALKKQISADESGLFGTDFTNNQIVDADIGGARREALNDALRSMLQLATYELLIQMMPPQKHAECTAQLDPRYGLITGEKTAGEQYIEYKRTQGSSEDAGAQSNNEESPEEPEEAAETASGTAPSGEGSRGQFVSGTEQANEQALQTDRSEARSGGVASDDVDSRSASYKRDPSRPPDNDPTSPQSSR